MAARSRRRGLQKPDEPSRTSPSAEVACQERSNARQRRAVVVARKLTSSSTQRRRCECLLTRPAADVADAYVSLLLHAGIAASDVICCLRLGEHAMGDSQSEEQKLLEKAAGKKPSNDLGTLRGVETKAGYSERPVSANDLTRAERAAERLLQLMRDLV